MKKGDFLIIAIILVVSLLSFIPIDSKTIGRSVTIIEEIKAAVMRITEQIQTLSSQISSVYDLVDSKSQTIISNIN